jgi:uncharacterized protein YggL (DUF469 family)
MKKRLRKKLRKGEFAQYGFYLNCLIDPRVFVAPDEEKETDAYFDWEEQIADFFHKEGYCVSLGGGTGDGKMGGFIQLYTGHPSRSRPRQMNIRDRERILDLIPRVVPGFIAARASELFDMWEWNKTISQKVDKYFEESGAELDRVWAEWAKSSNISV